MPKKYYTKLSKSTSEKRKRFWKSLGDYPFTKSEYKKVEEVPGDKNSKTRKSKYTVKFKKKFDNLEESKKKKRSKAIVALQKKAKASKIPYSILKKVYNRGMAAWVTGHRPGASQVQWALARVNSFITKGKTWKTTDSDLAKKVRNMKESINEDWKFRYIRSGFITDKGEVIEGNHTEIANKYGFIDRKGPVQKLGWIRYYITSEGEAAYNFNLNKFNDRQKLPKIIKFIKNHIQDNISIINTIFIDSGSVSNFLIDRIKNWAESLKNRIDEEHIFDYQHWGWITPVGDLILPTEGDTTHTSILRRLAIETKFEGGKDYNLDSKETEYSATNKGWIRWLVEGPALYLNTRKLIKNKEIWNTLRSLIYKHKVNRDFMFEYMDSRKDNLKRIEYGRGQFRPFLLSVSKLYNIKEDFDLSNYRSWFGWIKPDGKELRPKDAYDEYHADLINNYAKGENSKNPYGWIRWSVSTAWRSGREKIPNFQINSDIKSLSEPAFKTLLKVAKEIEDFFEIASWDVIIKGNKSPGTSKVLEYKTFLELKTNLSIMRRSSNLSESKQEYKKIVIFPGGFHPPHSGHLSVWQDLKDKFPDADVYVAATNNITERPFDFSDKLLLWEELGIDPNFVVQVKVPYVAKEITSKYDENNTVVIFALSEKDSGRISYTKKDGTPGYFSKWNSETNLKPLSEKGYIYVAPKIDFKILGVTIDSASKVRELYKKSSEENRIKIIKELYPNSKNIDKIKDILDKNLLQEINEKIVKKDNKFHVYSKKGKHLGGPYTLEKAKKRLKQIEFYK